MCLTTTIVGDDRISHFAWRNQTKRKTLNWMWSESTTAAVRLYLTMWALAYGNTTHNIVDTYWVSWLVTCCMNFTCTHLDEWTSAFVGVCVRSQMKLADVRVLVRWWRCETHLSSESMLLARSQWNSLDSSKCAYIACKSLRLAMTVLLFEPVAAHIHIDTTTVDAFSFNCFRHVWMFQREPNVIVRTMCGTWVSAYAS